MPTRGQLLSPTVAIVASLFISAALGAQTASQDGSGEAPEYGPGSGTLVIAGGGSMTGTGIVERFIELGGGAEQGRFVIVPTAGGNRTGDGSIRVYDEQEVIASWARRGLKNVTMLHTHDPAVADTEEFVRKLREATAVWFEGGRQWNIVDSYAGTLTEREFHEVLERGGVIGGTSAGATIQGHYLTRGDTRNNTIVMTDEPNHQLGFGFLRRSAIDQHINTRMRWDDLVAVVDSMPELLGIGLSEGTAIVVSGDTFEVIGKWVVTMHDNSRVYQPWEKPYYVLWPGDVYDLNDRRVVARGIGNGRRGGPPPAVQGEGGRGGASGRAGGGAGGGR
jgi:cyanophycinase